MGSLGAYACLARIGRIVQPADTYRQGQLLVASSVRHLPCSQYRPALRSWLSELWPVSAKRTALRVPGRAVD